MFRPTEDFPPIGVVHAIGRDFFRQLHPGFFHRDATNGGEEEGDASLAR